jgi:hypothetical protein
MRGSAQFLDCRGLLVDLIPLALIQLGNFVNAGYKESLRCMKREKATNKGWNSWC